jgi:oligoribonuclease
MRYISIDLETSGLNPERNQILSFGAIIEDTEKKLPLEECPSFYKLILQREITGSPFALSLNSSEIKDISEFIEGSHDDENLYCEPDKLTKEFYDFLWENNMAENSEMLISDVRHKGEKVYPMFNSKTKPIYINVAGKNFGTFDKLFLEKLPWWKKLIKVRSRILDPGILYLDWKNDDQIPSLNMCKGRAGIDGEVSHNALDDAWDVISVLRKFY